MSFPAQAPFPRLPKEAGKVMGAARDNDLRHLPAMFHVKHRHLQTLPTFLP
jgi:hypothetical protein